MLTRVRVPKEVGKRMETILREELELAKIRAEARLRIGMTRPPRQDVHITQDKTEQMFQTRRAPEDIAFCVEAYDECNFR